MSGGSAPEPRVLILGADPAVGAIVEQVARSVRMTAARASGAADAVAALQSAPDLVVADLALADRPAADWVAELRSRSPESELIVCSDYASVDEAVACMRSGAFDVLEKPLRDLVRLERTLRRASERQRLRVSRRPPAQSTSAGDDSFGIVFRSASMRRVLRTLLDLGPSESNVLIEAESGTGKELVARAIHATSPRRSGPFVPVDCGALPEGIAEGELFGYERGAFTGAVRSSPGLFRSAEGGTLFLDEIAELSLPLQSKLLRALQEREVRPLGTGAPRAVDVRVVAATHRELAQRVREGRFRADLFYRLRVVALGIPPLRERPDDIPALALHFLSRPRGRTGIAGIEPEAMDALVAHPWEGNVRELENVIEAAAALARGPRLTRADLGLSTPPPRVARPTGIELSLASFERACLEQALAHAEGDVPRAARLLGIGRSTLYRKLSRHGIPFQRTTRDPAPAGW
jgi:DNA-binding NtrC family response regulator